MSASKDLSPMPPNQVQPFLPWSPDAVLEWTVRQWRDQAEAYKTQLASFVQKSGRPNPHEDVAVGEEES